MKRLTGDTGMGGPFPYELLDHTVNPKDFGTYEAFFDYNVAVRRLGELEDALVPMPLEEWHEDIGVCVWWEFPIREEPYIGSPLDVDFPSYVTHFTLILEPLLEPWEVE